MMLANALDLVKDARRQGYAVGSFNVFGLSVAMGVIEAAVEQRSPVVLAISGRHCKFVHLEAFAKAVIEMADAVDVPVAFHLDHSPDLELVYRAMSAGFTSVMFDGHGLTFEQKIEKTQDLAKMAHENGVGVETELGHIGRVGQEQSELTDPHVAKEFTERTGVDILAVAIGSVHGMTSAKASLELDRLEEISSQVRCYLSLHGGSGVPDDIVPETFRRGIVKVSYFTGMAKLAMKRIGEALAGQNEPGDLPQVVDQARDSFREAAAKKMSIYGSAGRV